ncbi:hypothetical protein [Helicobacter pylori]|uniref:hypothetical protein n=1 Tax=Helicobacter pylori TaxID=210 RepID=UPI0012B1BB55|nr:hypothetical protein [Helicobacter pylori]
MLDERFLRVLYALVFLFCLLEIFELVLSISGINKTENLEYQLRQNLEMLGMISNSWNEHAECMGLKHYKKR